MGHGFARYLYVPEDGTRFSSATAAKVEQALRDAGLAVGPDGEGTQWKPMRPSGALASWAERAGLVHPTIDVDWHDDATEIYDSYLPPRGPWSRCPDCAKLLPTHGTVIRTNTDGEDEMVLLEECPSCGSGFEPYAWERAQERVIFRSRFVVGILADSYQSPRPTFRDGCPQFVRCVEEVLALDTLREVFVAW